MQTQLLGQPVKHRLFGKGIITDLSGKIVTIHFEQGEKKFLYPEAFSSFLTLKDTVKQKEVTAKYNRRLEAEEAVRREECEKLERRRQILAVKIAPNAQAAFHLAGNDAEKLLRTGFISTGRYLSGQNKGEPRIPNRLKPNSACLLTGLPESREEKDRRILGAFMVKEDFLGEWCKDGVVECHAEYQMCLPQDRTLPYWDYFEHGETFSRWGNVAFKYFANETMQRILLDMAGLLDSEGQESAAEFCLYFSKINRLPVPRTKDADLQ